MVLRHTIMHSTTGPPDYSRLRTTTDRPRRNARVGETGDHRENLPTSGIVQHDFHVRKGPVGNQTRFASVGAPQSCLSFRFEINSAARACPNEGGSHGFGRCMHVSPAPSDGTFVRSPEKKHERLWQADEFHLSTSLIRTQDLPHPRPAAHQPTALREVDSPIIIRRDVRTRETGIPRENTLPNDIIGRLFFGREIPIVSPPEIQLSPCELSPILYIHDRPMPRSLYCYEAMRPVTETEDHAEKMKVICKASPGTIPACENTVSRPGIEPGSPWWEASRLTSQPPRPHRMASSGGYVLRGTPLYISVCENLTDSPIGKAVPTRYPISATFCYTNGYNRRHKSFCSRIEERMYQFIPTRYLNANPRTYPLSYGHNFLDIRLRGYSRKLEDVLLPFRACPWVRELLYPEPDRSGGGWIVNYTGAEMLAENGYENCYGNGHRAAHFNLVFSANKFLPSSKGLTDVRRQSRAGLLARMSKTENIRCTVLEKKFDSNGVNKPGIDYNHYGRVEGTFLFASYDPLSPLRRAPAWVARLGLGCVVYTACFARRGDERVDAHVSVAPSALTLLGLGRAKSLRPGGHLNCGEIEDVTRRQRCRADSSLLLTANLRRVGNDARSRASPVLRRSAIACDSALTRFLALPLTLSPAELPALTRTRKRRRRRPNSSWHNSAASHTLPLARPYMDVDHLFVRKCTWTHGNFFKYCYECTALLTFNVRAAGSWNIRQGQHEPDTTKSIEFLLFVVSGLIEPTYVRLSGLRFCRTDVTVTLLFIDCYSDFVVSELSCRVRRSIDCSIRAALARASNASLSP
ncbi:hypothetical protein PR048_017633 [Dryococelus australis]|uniref:Uncharacterized protein n=1 Tax=Dryococelus australis TaxID=614101 RepID=A0ABQ9HA28_9NEOP|nr:hypothetical protein PR048_017633 [Dryococelus australis]